MGGSEHKHTDTQAIAETDSVIKFNGQVAVIRLFF